MLMKGMLASPLSGKMGGMVASHNAGGTYFRRLVIPTNPSTPPQALNRSVFATASALWTTLTVAQRDAWQAYGSATTRTNRVGDTIHLSGLSAFQALNAPRVSNGLPIVIDPPPTTPGFDPSISPPTSVSIAIPIVGNDISVTFDNTQAWANEDGGAMLVYVSPQVSQSINFYKGKFRQTNLPILGDAMTAPTSPATLVSGYPAPFVTPGRIFWRIRSTRADGSLGVVIDGRQDF